MQLTNRRVRLMGTVIDVSIYHKEPEPLLDQVEALLHTYNKRFSANDDSSELMKINKAAGLHPVTVHPELFELISLGKWHSCQPGSHLNIAIGPLIQTWRIGFSDAKLPLPEEIRPLLDIINPNAILLSYGSLVAVHNPGMHASRFGLLPFRSPLLWKSIFLSFPPAT